MIPSVYFSVVLKWDNSWSNLKIAGTRLFLIRLSFFLNLDEIENEINNFRTELKQANQLEYLGFIIDSNLDLNTQAAINFKKVQSSFFGISYLLPKNSPSSSTKFKSFIYKTYCLSKFTYGLEALTLNSNTKDSINKLLNNLIRQMFDNSWSNLKIAGTRLFLIILILDSIKF
ncbi:hypothetical protein BpHYR1_038920 [Brachionus plicatilis]|uniref:RNA-directed DNA polymerase from mobile element jockey-like n=1 Tax=Brachionus plicatilis TaxID=10195 RepID=A0A3M7S0P6_BRAPC|nr:hypothetical protein BpHYR1_038920 [Brachionus plicatilis]